MKPMPRGNDGTDIPVLVLYNVDPAWTPDEQREVVSETQRLGDALQQIGHPVVLSPLSDSNLSSLLAQADPDRTVVFNWCESVPGVPDSEPLVPAVMEAQGFVYTGSPADVLRRSQDKAQFKEVMEAAGVPTPGWVVADTLEHLDGWDLFPAIVKASHEHGSAELDRNAVVLDRTSLQARVAHVLDVLHQPALVEEFVDGREFHVSLWGNGRIQMLPPAEFGFAAFSDVRDRICSYEAKFVPGSPAYSGITTQVPADLLPEESRQLEACVRQAYRAVGCRDYARIDVRCRDGMFYVLDVNPNADVSAEASMALAAEAAGFSYGQMGSRLVQLAAHRHPRFNRWH